MDFCSNKQKNNKNLNASILWETTLIKLEAGCVGKEEVIFVRPAKLLDNQVETVLFEVQPIEKNNAMPREQFGDTWSTKTSLCHVLPATHSQFLLFCITQFFFFHITSLMVSMENY